MGTAIAHASPSPSNPEVSRTSNHDPHRLSVYVHFPWCLAKCPYCDFVSYASRREDIDHEAYADAVASELATRVAACGRRPVTTVFFGGGTPSLWKASCLGRVLRQIRDTFPTPEDLEVTVECNPTSLDREHADALAEQGVNRLSIGAQALRGDQLRFLGRLHDPEGALRAVKDALASAVPRVSADLIFGLPDQRPEDAASQADKLAALGLEHISAYQLTIEPGTKFGELARAGRLPRADDALVVECFLAVDEALASHGLAHYEISNYAKEGQEARHNLGYWRGDEYLGIGCAAYGFLRRPDGGVRYRNHPDPPAYLRGAHSGDAEDSSEDLLPETLLRERIMLGLRVLAGFDLEKAAEELGVSAWTPGRERAAAWLVQRGRLERRGPRLRIPKSAWIWADDTAARLF